MLSRPRSYQKWVLMSLAALLVLTVPLWANPYLLSVFIFIGIYSMVAVGLCLLMGYAGQPSLGQSAFYGTGAYATAILTTGFGISPWLAMMGGAALSGAIAYITGVRILRLHGMYLAMVTIALADIFMEIFIKWKPVTGGYDGLGGIPRLAIGGLVVKQDSHYYYLVLVALTILFIVAQNLVKSKIGLEMRAMHLGSGGSEMAAQSLGVDVVGLKTFCFVIASVYASIAGSIYAHYVTYVNPEPFSMGAGILILMMVVIGGQTPLWGGITGAAVVVVLKEVVANVMHVVAPRAPAGYETIIFGIVFVLSLIFLPKGVVSLFPKAQQWWVRRTARG